MIISSITHENLKIFERLLPDYLTGDLGQAHRFALGAIGGEEDNLYAAGALIFDVVSGSNGSEDLIVAELKWLYVVEEHRRKGVADALMNELFVIVENSGIVHLMCDLPFLEDYDFLCHYLEAWGFEFHLQDIYELSVSLEELVSKPMLKKKLSAVIFALKDISNLNFRQFINQVRKLPDVLDELSDKKESYDCNVSSCSLEGGQIVGAMLVRRVKADELELMLMRSLKNEPAIMANLLRYSVQAAQHYYPPEAMVNITCRAAFSGDVIDRLFPDKQPAVVRRGYYEITEV